MSYTKQDSDYMRDLHAMSKKLKAKAEEQTGESRKELVMEQGLTKEEVELVLETLKGVRELDFKVSGMNRSWNILKKARVTDKLIEKLELIAEKRKVNKAEAERTKDV